MATRRPLVLKNGHREEMPVGDELPADVIPSTPAPTQRTFAYFLAG